MDRVNLRFWCVNELFSVKLRAEVPLQNENPLNHQILWQHYIERKKSLSPENKVSRFCEEAGFMSVVEVGQYFVTKDTGSLRQFRSVACREYTLPRDDPPSQPKRWIQGNMTIGPVLEVTTQFQNGKHGIEIRIWSVNQNNSQSSVRISHGTIKYVVDSNQNNTEIPADPQEDQVPQPSIKVVATQGKRKTTTKRSCWNTNYQTDARKKICWFWAIRTNSRCVRSLEENDQSSSTQSNSTTGRRWSNWILQDKVLSSKSFLTSTALVWWSLEILFGSTKRFEKEISVLLW